MDFSDDSVLQLSRKGAVLYATMNRPEAMNAINDCLEQALTALFVDVVADMETRVVVLSGADRVFSAGGDLQAIQQMIDTPGMMHEMIPRSKRLLQALVDCPKPVIARLNGHAAGLGATVALFCDLVFATPQARISDAHVRLGLVAGDGGAVIWPQLVGYARAREYLLTGDPITGEEAARIGLINRAVPADELDVVVDGCAQKLAALPPRAVQWSKLAINVGLRQAMAAGLDAGIAYEALSNRTADHQTALQEARRRQGQARHARD